MEVIFDSPNLKPRLSPAMRTALSVLGLIGRTLVETNKCMKERLADEAAQAPTLDDVMKQSGLHIPGLEEALAQFMGGGDEARRVAAMVANAPDPVTLLNRLMANFGAEPAPAKSPIVTPPPAAANAAPPASAAPPAGEAGNLAAFRADFTREGRQAATSPAPPSEPPGLPLFRPDFTREGREAAKAAAPSPDLPDFRPDLTPEIRRTAQVHGAEPVQGSAPAATTECMTLLGSLAHQLEAIRRNRKSFEAMVEGRLVVLEAELARLREEFDRLYAALVSKARSQSEEAAAAAADGGDATTTSAEAAAPGASEAGVAADEASQPDSVDPEHGANELAADEPGTPPAEPLPPAASAEEVAQAIDLVTTFAGETQAAEAQQVARITAVEREVARMRALVESAGAALGGAGAHA